MRFVESRRDIPKIAQRFNAGATGNGCPSPEGATEVAAAIEIPLGRPFGTRIAACGQPSVETLGYYQISLRERNEQFQTRIQDRNLA